MFQYTNNLIDTDLSSWNVSQATELSNMFFDSYSWSGCELNAWDTSRVTDVANMFYNSGQATVCLIKLNIFKSFHDIVSK